jgi:hypothetical protein
LRTRADLAQSNRQVTAEAALYGQGRVRVRRDNPDGCIYAYELTGPRDLGLLLGIQQAVFAIGGALGPVALGALLGATGSYTPTIVTVTAGFAAAAGLLLLGSPHEPAAPA